MPFRFRHRGRTVQPSHPRRAHIHVPRSPLHRAVEALANFAGSIGFLVLHAIWFAVWLATSGFGQDRFPFGELTLIVSLEAIFLSTLILISERRQSERDRKRDDIEASEVEDDLALTKDIHGLTTEIHEIVTLLKEARTADRQILEMLERALARGGNDGTA